MRNRARATGFANAGAGFGGAVSPILFTWMIGRYGWRNSFYLAGLATAVLGIGWYLYVRDYPPGVEPPQAVVRDAPAPWRALLTDKNIVLLTLGFAALDYFEYIFFYWIFYYLGEIRHLGAAESARYTTLLFLAWVVMMPMGGFLCDRLMSRFGHKYGLRLMACTSLLLSAILLFAGVNATMLPVRNLLECSQFTRLPSRLRLKEMRAAPQTPNNKSMWGNKFLGHELAITKPWSGSTKNPLAPPPKPGG